MKILLRSMIVSSPTTDDPENAFRNYLSFMSSGLGFDTPQDLILWDFIKVFVQSHNHVPLVGTIRSHFGNLQEVEILDRLEILLGNKPIYRGDFLKRLEQRAEDRRLVLVKEYLQDASQILLHGREEKKGKDKKHLRGPIDAIRFLIEKSHDIVMPTTGQRLSGEVTRDGKSAWQSYEKVKADPLSGIGCFTGLKPMDLKLKGAKRGQLWTHAAFTGHGKCTGVDTRVFDPVSGIHCTIQEACGNPDFKHIHSFDEESGRMVVREIKQIVESGTKKVFRVKTNTGREIAVTAEHPMLSTSGWKALSELTVGMSLAVPSYCSGSETSPFSDVQVQAVGYMLGDGSMTRNLGFTNGRPEVFREFLEILLELGYFESKKDPSQKGLPLYRTRLKRGSREVNFSVNKKISPLWKLLDQLDLYGCDSGTKFIPDEFMQLPDRQLWMLLGALWATDGYITGGFPREGKKLRNPTVEILFKSEQLSRGVFSILSRLGIPATVKPNYKTYKGEKREYWRVVVCTLKGKLEFLRRARIVGKDAQIREVLASSKDLDTRGDTRVPVELLDGVPPLTRIRSREGRSWRYANFTTGTKNVSLTIAQGLAKEAGNTQLEHTLQSDIRWERIVSITEEEECLVYDMEIPGCANFVADGFISHNSVLSRNWAYNAAVWGGHNSVILSLEMPYEQCRASFNSLHSQHHKFRDIRMELGIQPRKDVTVGLSYEKIMDGGLSPEEEKFYKEYVIPDFEHEDHGKIHIEVADPDKDDFTVLDLKMKAELLYSKEPFSVLFVDHALLLHPRRHMNSTTENINSVIRDLKKLSMSFNRGAGIAIVALFQINRKGFEEAMKNGGIYNLTHLSYANEAERSSDIVTASWAPDDMRKGNRIQFQCLKSRDRAPFDTFQCRCEWHNHRIVNFDYTVVEPLEKSDGKNHKQNHKQKQKDYDFGTQIDENGVDDVFDAS